MKTRKFRFQAEIGRKKSTQKFKESIEYDELDLGYKRLKDVGRRMHLQKTVKDLYRKKDM